jgi:hypothetical protein
MLAGVTSRIWGGVRGAPGGVDRSGATVAACIGWGAGVTAGGGVGGAGAVDAAGVWLGAGGGGAAALTCSVVGAAGADADD